MLWFSNTRPYSIGIEMAKDHLKLAQLGRRKRRLCVLGEDSVDLPESIEPGGIDWQKWAIETLRSTIQKGKYKGRNVTAVTGADEVIIEHIKANGVSEDKVEEYIYSKLKHRLELTESDSVVKHIRSDDNNLIVLVSDRNKIDRHVAIYEQSGLAVQSIIVWPMALAETYVNFFGRRLSDLETVVMLIDIESHRTNVVIARHRNIFFARSLPTGICELNGENKAESSLLSELNGCKEQFYSMYGCAKIQRLVFLSGRLIPQEICLSISKHLGIASHLGDCLGAVEFNKNSSSGINRRESRYSWATAFGLSLSLKK